MTVPARILQSLPWMAGITAQILELYQQNRLPHGICLQAGKGYGKKHQLRFLARALLCKNQSQFAACGVCQHCILMSNHEHPDFMAVTAENTSQIGIAQIRQIHDFVTGTAFLAPVRLVVIDELERMTLAAANALLKHLEEPPPRVYFLLSTAKPSHLLPTVRSRIQFFPLAIPDFKQVSTWLATQLPKNNDNNLVVQSFELAQSSPLAALEYLARHQGITEISNDLVLDFDPKQPDLLGDYVRVLTVMDQTAQAIRIHLSVLVKSMNLNQATLFFELWLQRELQAKSIQLSNAKIESYWSALSQVQALQAELARSPQLNPIHLKRRLLKAWFACQKDSA